MERTLILVRHGDALPQSIGETDFDRKLSPKGVADVAHLGQRLRLRKIVPGAIVSSPARRTRETALLLAGEIGLQPSSILLEDGLYQSHIDSFADFLAGLPVVDDCETLLLVAHNPGISHFAYDLLPGCINHSMVPAAAIEFSGSGETWNDFMCHPRKLVFFDSPNK